MDYYTSLQDLERKKRDTEKARQSQMATWLRMPNVGQGQQVGQYYVANPLGGIAEIIKAISQGRASKKYDQDMEKLSGEESSLIAQRGEEQKNLMSTMPMAEAYIPESDGTGNQQEITRVDPTVEDYDKWASKADTAGLSAQAQTARIRGTELNNRKNKEFYWEQQQAQQAQIAELRQLLAAMGGANKLDVQGLKNKGALGVAETPRVNLSGKLDSDGNIVDQTQTSGTHTDKQIKDTILSKGISAANAFGPLDTTLDKYNVKTNGAGYAYDQGTEVPGFSMAAQTLGPMAGLVGAEGLARRTIDGEDANKVLSDVQQVLNTVRHSEFGSALTRQEVVQFEKKINTGAFKNTDEFLHALSRLRELTMTDLWSQASRLTPEQLSSMSAGMPSGPAKAAIDSALANRTRNDQSGELSGQSFTGAAAPLQTSSNSVNVSDGDAAYQGWKKRKNGRR